MIEAPSQDKSSLDGAAPGAANGPWFKFGLSVEIVADWQPPETYAVWLLNPSVGGGGGSMGGLGDGGVLGGVTVGTSRYGEFTFVENCRSTPLLPPVGNTIQPLFVRLPASHAATDEVTSNLCQPVATPGMAPSNPTPPTLVELHDDDANGRLVHVTVVCRKQAGAERDISAKGSQPGGAA